ncbi:MAG TPA: low-specificity L-threonine aldolase [Anaerolineales bacterium]|nr:low-specificity L-threonine aldolase [Anaerolineales bacterium]
MIDLRSDTVTKPTPEMRAAMAEAEVGDDVFGEDPTINRLQELAAAMLGKEAALFVASGTMGNLAAVLAHCGRGDEVILGDLSHTYLYEAGGISALGGVHPRTLPNLPDGTLDPAAIASAVREDDEHYPISRLVCLETTHNRCRGVALAVEYIDAVGELAHHRGLKLHIDGARLFNASVALDVDPARMAAAADSVTFCLSKALSAPVGSVIVGDADFIARARRARKALGGGMRQAGVLAAAGIVALTSMVERLADDHARARRLAEGLAEIDGVRVENERPATNMVYITIDPAVQLDDHQIMERMEKRGVLIHDVGPRRFRLVTHCWVGDEDVETALAAFDEALAMV